MLEFKADPDTPMVAAPSALAAAEVANPVAEKDGSPKRKIARSGGITTHVTQFQASTSTPPATQLPAIPPAAKTSYAGAIASAALTVNPAKPIATSSVPNVEPPSLCLQAMITGAKMLRKSKSLPASPSDVTTALLGSTDQVGTLQQETMETLRIVWLH